MWNPNSADKNFSLTIQFNKQVSDAGYASARDQVLLTAGVKMTSEDAAARTMAVNYTPELQSKINAIAGVESTGKVRISGSDHGGGCFGPNNGRRW